MASNVHPMMNSQVRKDRLKLSQKPSIIAMNTVGFRVLSSPQLINDSGTVTWSAWINNIAPLSLNTSTGELTISPSAMPTASTTYYIGLAARDSSGVYTRYKPLIFSTSAFIALDMTVPMIIGTPNGNFSYIQPTATMTCTWSLGNIQKPEGFENVDFSISESGTLSITGTSTAIGTATFDVTIIDQYQRTLTKTFSVICTIGDILVSSDAILTDRSALITSTSTVFFLRDMSVRIFAVGGGASGGAGTTNQYGGQGGGSGFFNYGTYSVTSGSQYTATIGTKGALPTAFGTNGTNGVATTFKKSDGTVLLTANPGQAGGAGGSSTNISTTGIGWSNGGASAVYHYGITMSGGLGGSNGYNSWTIADPAFTLPSNQGPNIPITLPNFKYLTLNPGKPGKSVVPMLTSTDGGNTWLPDLCIPMPTTSSTTHNYSFYSGMKNYLPTFKTSFGYNVAVWGVQSAVSNYGTFFIYIDNWYFYNIDDFMYEYTNAASTTLSFHTVFRIGDVVYLVSPTQTFKITFNKNRDLPISVLTNNASFNGFCPGKYSSTMWGTKVNSATSSTVYQSAESGSTLSAFNTTKTLPFSCSDIIYLPEFDRVVAMGYTTNNYFCWSYSPHDTATTPSSWTDTVTSVTFDAALNRAVYSPTLKMLIVKSGNYNKYYYSMDGGITFTLLDGTTNGMSAAGIFLQTIEWVPFANKWYATGYSNTTGTNLGCVFTSDDGLTWTKILLPTPYDKLLQTKMITYDPYNQKIHLLQYVYDSSLSAALLNGKVPHGYPGIGYGAGGGGGSNWASLNGAHPGGGGGGGITINGYAPTQNTGVLDFTKYGTPGSDGAMYIEWDVDPTPIAPIDSSDPYFSNVSLLMYDTEQNGKSNTAFSDSGPYNFALTPTSANSGQPPVQITNTPYLDEGYWSAFFTGTSLVAGFATSYQNVPASTSLNGFVANDFTVEMWVKPETYSATQRKYLLTLVNSTLSTNADVEIMMSIYVDGKLNFKGGSSSGYLDFSSNTAIPLNMWTHIAVTKVGTSYSIYLNGNLDSTTVYEPSLNVLGTGQSTLYIGKLAADGTLTAYNGYISNLRIVSGSAIYTGNFTVPTSPLTRVSGTVLLCCQSNRAKDNSVNNATMGNSSTYSLPRSPFNALTYDPNVHGGSVYLSGSVSNILLNPTVFPNASQAFTMECWFYPLNNSNNNVQLFGNWIGTTVATATWGVFYSLSPSTPNAYLYFMSGTSTTNYWGFGVTVNKIQMMAWNHIAITRDQSFNMKIFINGEYQSSASTFAGGTGSWAPNSSFTDVGTPMRIGGAASANSPNGFIADTRITMGRCLYTTSFNPNTSPLTVIPKNTVWHMQYKNANILDAAKNAMLTYPDVVVSNTTSKVGSTSIYFPGTTNSKIYAINPSTILFGTSDFTMEFWMNPSTLSDTMKMMGYNNYIGSSGGATWGAHQWTLAPSVGGKLRWNVYNYNTSSPLLQSTSTITTGTWTHVAITRSGSTFRLFINGTLEATTTSSISVDDVSQYSICIGWSSVLGDAYYQGYLEELRITKGVARYIDNFTPSTDPLPRR